MFNSKKEDHRLNYQFELNRSWFYRQLNREKREMADIFKEDIVDFCKEMWKRKDVKVPTTKLRETFSVFEAGEKGEEIELDSKTVYEMIKYLPNWRAWGLDRIYGFWIKRLTSVHDTLATHIIEIYDKPSEATDWF